MPVNSVTAGFNGWGYLQKHPKSTHCPALHGKQNLLLLSLGTGCQQLDRDLEEGRRRWRRGPHEGTQFKCCCERSCQGIIEGGEEGMLQPWKGRCPGQPTMKEAMESWAFSMSSSFVPESPSCECPSGKKQQVAG